MSHPGLASSSSAARPTGARPAWVHRPWIDLLIGCGGWSAPLLLISYQLIATDAQAWSALFYGLALVCNYPHYMATIHRAYGRRTDRSHYRLFTHYVTAALAIVAVAAHVDVRLLAWLFTAYVMWSPWHYTGQNFGISMMFLRRAGVDVSPRERQWLHAAFIASYVLLLAAFNEGASADPLVLSLGLPRELSLSVQIAAAAMFVVAGGAALVPLLRRAGWRVLAAPATLYCTQALWFVVPIVVSWTSAAAAPQTRYSSGILAVMHSAQYLWITQHFAKRDARASAVTAGASATVTTATAATIADAGAEAAARPGALAAPGGWSPWRYWATLVVGGVALFLPGPWLASYAGRFDFTSSMLIVTAIVNIHHFILDGVVWKLRDPRVAKVLVSDDGPATTGAVPSGAATASAVATGPDATGPTATGTAAANVPAVAWWRRRPLVLAMQAMAALLLVSLAAVDQWRYLLALGGSDRQSLAAADALNPYDSSVHLRLAMAAGRDGDAAAAEGALRRAVELNAQSLAPYHALERFLLVSGRLPDAYAHCKLLLQRWPRDVDTLVNAGILAQKLGDSTAAEAWWRRALDEDDSLAHVHLYLGEMVDAAGRSADALPHYQRYLELVVQAREQARDDAATPPRQVALVVVKLGEALAKTGQPSLARAQYDLAARIAKQHALGDVEMMARERQSTLDHDTSRNQ